MIWNTLVLSVKILMEKFFASKAETDNLRKESYPLKRKCPTGTDRVAAYHTHGADSHGDYVDEFFQVAIKIL